VLLVRQGPQPVELGIGPCREIPLGAGWDGRVLVEGPQAAAAATVRSDGHALLAALAGRPITERIEAMFLVGAERLTDPEVLFRLFPRLQHLYVFEPRPASRERLQHLAARDARIRLFPHDLSNGALAAALGPGGARPDMLMVETPGAELPLLAALPEPVRRGVQIIHAAASTAAGDLKTRLDPQFMFVAFRPGTPQSPAEGDALFVNRDAVSLLAPPSPRGPA